MDWIRRNWPDLLIGIALLLVIAGIIATLLSGGTILPFAGNNQNPQTSPVTTTETSTTPTTNAVAEATNGLENTANAATQALENTANQVGEAATNTADNTVNAVAAGIDAVAESTENIIAPVIPGSTDADTASSTDTTTSTAADDTSSTSTSTNNDSTTSASVATSSTISTAAPVNVAASSSSTAPYRVSVGAFGSVENAERQAQTFRDAGYPVFLGSQGSLSLVLVGPYDSSSEAEAVQAQIRSSGLEPGAAIYKLDDTEDNATDTATTATSQATTTESTTATNTTSTTVATPSSSSVPVTATSGRYLQVGAYNSVESSLPQRQLLEGFGFTVVHIEESNFIKLLVGPYDSTNLGLAQTQLNARGIESFVR